MRIHTMRDLGAAVRQARTEQHLTQAMLADRIGVSRDWVVRLEKGHPRLEVRLVLEAVGAVGLSLRADAESDSPTTRTNLPWDDVFLGLTATRTEEGHDPVSPNG